MSVQRAPEIELEVHEDPALGVAWVLNATGAVVCDFGCILLGWAATETSGTAGASVDIYNEAGHAGNILLPIRLASGESAESWYGPGGIKFHNAIYVNVSAGQARGALFYRHLRGR